MIVAEQFMASILDRGYRFWTGVPCSFLTPFINYVLQDSQLRYIGATSEGEAVALAAGATFAGRKAVAICQNSGLGNMVNPLTSLAYPFRVPLLLIVTHRGEPGLKDEPQHELMGQVTKDLLDLMKIRWAAFPQEASSIESTLEHASRTMDETGLPFALVMSKGAVSPVALGGAIPPRVRPKGVVRGSFEVPLTKRMSRRETIETVTNALRPDSAVVATTGMTGRELFSLGYRENHVYVVGSMGCASGIGLGLCLGSENRTGVTVLDGDGSALMKLGTFATIGHHRPESLLHVLLDNESHDSTGGQATVSPTVDFAEVALACGYRAAFRVDTSIELCRIISEAALAGGPTLVHVKVAPGSTPNLGRPTLSPVEVKDRFMRWYAARQRVSRMTQPA